MRTPTGIFYINGKYKNRIISERVLVTWAFYNIVDTSDIAISHYTNASKMLIRPGTLIRPISGSEIYLIEGKYRRKIVSPDVLDQLNLTEDDALPVSEEELQLHDEGEVLK